MPWPFESWLILLLCVKNEDYFKMQFKKARTVKENCC